MRRNNTIYSAQMLKPCTLVCPEQRQERPRGERQTIEKIEPLVRILSLSLWIQYWKITYLNLKVKDIYSEKEQPSDLVQAGTMPVLIWAHGKNSFTNGPQRSLRSTRVIQMIFLEFGSTRRKNWMSMQHQPIPSITIFQLLFD